MNLLDELKPTALWHFFKELSAIPRCTGKETAVSDYIIAQAKKYHCSAIQDKAGNIIIKKPATTGYHKAPLVIIQSHLDMVCEKASTTVHDFKKDPIKLVKKNDYIHADGTTLGADDGIGVAAMLTLLQDNSITHGPLELVFTVNEARGTRGAYALSPTILQGRILINLDSEEDGTLFIGCAGGIDTIGTLPITLMPVPADHRALTLQLSGLQGGHSGLEINLGRANAVKVLTRLINTLLNYNAHLVHLESGSFRNAIPAEAAATILIPELKSTEALEALSLLFKCIKKEHELSDPNMTLAITNTRSQKNALSADSSKKLINILLALPQDVLRMNPSMPNTVSISTNIARVTMDSNFATIETKQRGMSEVEKAYAHYMVSSVFELAQASVITADDYPAWQPYFNTTLSLQAQATYRKTFGRDPKVKAVHAGLECAIIAQKIPDIQMISFGPTIEGGHSPNERLRIDTVPKFWTLLTALLKDIAQRHINS